MEQLLNAVWGFFLEELLKGPFLVLISIPIFKAHSLHLNNKKQFFKSKQTNKLEIGLRKVDGWKQKCIVCFWKASEILSICGYHMV